MKIERAKDGSGMLLMNAKGEFMKVSFMEFWEICKAGDRMDTLDEVENYLGDCNEIEGYDAKRILEHSELLNNIVEGVIQMRIDNESLDQIYEASKKKAKEIFEEEIPLVLYESGEDDEETINFNVPYYLLQGYAKHFGYNAVEEFLLCYINDEARIIYYEMKEEKEKKARLKYHSDCMAYINEVNEQQKNINNGYISVEQAQTFLDDYCKREDIDMEIIKEVTQDIKLHERKE